MSIVDDEGVSNTSGNEYFQDIVQARLSRRSFLTGGVAAAAVVSLSGLEALLNSLPASAQEIAENVDDAEERTEGRERRSPMLAFESVPVSSADDVVVPKGYKAEVLIAWGDPLSNGPVFKQDASNTAAEQASQWGMHNDGIVYSPILRSQRGLIVQNNEYTDDGLLFPAACSGSRPMCRPPRSTRAPMSVLATIRCWPRILKPERAAAFWSDRVSVKLPVSS